MATAEKLTLKHSADAPEDEDARPSKRGRLEESHGENLSVAPSSVKTVSDLDQFDRTFFISAGVPAQLSHDCLKKHLAKAGLSEISRVTSTTRPTFVWAELINLRFGRELYDLHCGIKNLLSNDKYLIARKDTLYAAMKEKFPIETKAIMAETFSCDDLRQLPDIGADDVVIFRPIDGFCGRGITVLHGPSSRKVREAVEYARSEAKRIKRAASSKVIMSRYERHPLLWNGRKFHLRSYFLVSVMQGKFRSYFWDEGEMFTAGKPYVDGDFGNHDIHDTHAKTTDGDLCYPSDLYAAGAITPEQFAVVNAALKRVMVLVSQVFVPHARPYSESKFAFEVFACDFLVRTDFSVLLMEINDKVGYGFHTKEHTVTFSARYFEWVCAAVVDPLFHNVHTLEPLFETNAVDSPAPP